MKTNEDYVVALGTGTERSKSLSLKVTAMSNPNPHNNRYNRDNLLNSMNLACQLDLFIALGCQENSSTKWKIQELQFRSNPIETQDWKGLPGSQSTVLCFHRQPHYVILLINVSSHLIQFLVSYSDRHQTLQKTVQRNPAVSRRGITYTQGSFFLKSNSWRSS